MAGECGVRVRGEYSPGHNLDGVDVPDNDVAADRRSFGVHAGFSGRQCVDAGGGLCLGRFIPTSTRS